MAMALDGIKVIDCSQVAVVPIIARIIGGFGAEASRAVATLPAASDLSVEKRVKLALQYLGG